jgi:hypothetical protein
MPMVVSSSGTIFAAGTSTGSLANTLLTIDPVTGQPTSVGAFGVLGMMDFAYDPNGALFGATTTKLYRITAVRLKVEKNQLVNVFGEIGVLIDGLKGA